MGEIPRKSVSQKTGNDFNSLHNPSSVRITACPLKFFYQKGPVQPTKVWHVKTCINS